MAAGVRQTCAGSLEAVVTSTFPSCSRLSCFSVAGGFWSPCVAWAELCSSDPANESRKARKFVVQVGRRGRLGKRVNELLIVSQKKLLKSDVKEPFGPSQWNSSVGTA